MTPVILETAIQISYLAEPLRESRAVAKAIHELLDAGIIEAAPRPPGYMLTTKGDKWLEMVLATPYPEHKWIDPRQYAKVGE